MGIKVVILQAKVFLVGLYYCLLFIFGLVYSKARVEDVKRGRNVWGFYGRRTVGKLAGSEGY